MTSAGLLGACLNGAIESAALVAVVAAILSLARRADATTRHRVWMLTLFAVIGLPIANVLAPLVLRGGEATIGAAVSGHSSSFASVALTSRGVIVVWSLWGAISSALIGRLVLAFFRLERLRKETSEVSPQLQLQVRSWGERMGIKRSVAVRSSRVLASPIAIGLRDPLVVIPERLLETLGDADLEFIVVHELAHLRRRDDVTNLLARIAHALFIFNPAILIIERRLAVEREIACDDWVVNTFGRAHRYARCLAHVVLLAPPRAVAQGYLRFFRSPEMSIARIEMLLAGPAPERFRVGHAALGVSLSAILGCFFIAMTAAPPIVVRMAFPSFLATVAPSLPLLTERYARAVALQPTAPSANASRTIRSSTSTALARALRAPREPVAYAPALSSSMHFARSTESVRVGASAATVAVSNDSGPRFRTDRDTILASDVRAGNDVKSEVNLQATRVSVGPTLDAGIPLARVAHPAVALELKYSSNGTAIASNIGVGPGGFVNTSSSGGGGGSSGGNTGSGTLDGVQLPPGNVGAPGRSGGHGRSEIPVERRGGP